MISMYRYECKRSVASFYSRTSDSITQYFPPFVCPSVRLSLRPFVRLDKLEAMARRAVRSHPACD